MPSVQKRKTGDQSLTLLEKHQSHSKMSPSPAAAPETICPGDDFELDTIQSRWGLELWVP